MMRVTTSAVANAKRTRGSIMAYLEGEKNLSWIAGTILSSGDIDAARTLLCNDLKGYGDPNRYEELGRWFSSRQYK